ncbi:MAG: MATE family efflux transporter [Oscillospiraceae bacterium]
MDENKMGSAPMTKLIISMSLPAMFSMFIQALYNIVDGIFVASLGGGSNSDAFNAVSLALPVQMLLIAFAVGTGIGLNSLISRKLGEKDFKKANLAATNGLFVAVVLWVIFAVFGFIFSNPFIKMFSADENVIRYGTEYLQIITVFSIGMFVHVAFEKTLQATGNMLYPMLFQLFGAITNIILDPILIFGLFGFPALEVKGAAIATVIGQLVAFSFSSYVVFTKQHGVKVTLKGFKPNIGIIKEIFKVGFPAIVMQSITSVLIVGINRILGSYSDDAIFVVGTYSKLQNFIFMPVFGLMQGMMPIMGYNYGARNKQRLTNCFKIGTLIALTIMTVGTVLFMVFPEALLRVFNATPSAMEMGVPALRIISVCFPVAAAGIAGSTFFQAIGKGVISLIISILRQLVIILPAVYFFAKYIGVWASWFAFPLSETFAFVVSVAWMIKIYKNDFKVYFDGE